jgi:hypothetical protein
MLTCTYPVDHRKKAVTQSQVETPQKKKKKKVVSWAGVHFSSRVLTSISEAWV